MHFYLKFFNFGTRLVNCIVASYNRNGLVKKSPGKSAPGFFYCSASRAYVPIQGT
jgi:hypothetical protein